MLDLKIIPNINNNSDLYIFFCEKNFSFNSKKLTFIDIDYKEINSLLLKNKDEDYFVFNYHSTKPKKIIFINQKNNKDGFEYQNIGGKVISEIKLAKDINVIFSNENKSLENYYFNFFLGCFLKKYSFTKYKTIFKKNENAKEIINLLITSSNKNFFIKIKNNIENIINGVFLTRDLVSEPPNYLNPERFVSEIKKLSKLGLKVDVFDYSKMKKIGMNALLGVAQGSKNLPYFVTITWKPNNSKNKKPLSFIGKGVCFDTGGLNLKPGTYMDLMKKDMGGAAVAIALAGAILDAQLPVRLRLSVGAVENAIGPDAFRPSDILKSRKGLTVEIGNTDAEGRLVLADLLSEAESHNPDLILDFATLTGAARVALGPEVIPFYTHDEELADALHRHSKSIYDPLWQMPLWHGYDGWLSSSIADVNHISSSPMAGSITAALFLSRFVPDDISWAHFDIYGWNIKARAGRPIGGEAHALRAAYAMIEERYGQAQ